MTLVLSAQTIEDMAIVLGNIQSWNTDVLHDWSAG